MTAPAINANPLIFTLIPVGLKEASLDSPSFRASIRHFDRQIEGIEQWIQTYLRAAVRLTDSLKSTDHAVNDILANSIPGYISESMMDHDYALQALRRYHEGSKLYWAQINVRAQSIERSVIAPLSGFLNQDIKSAKEQKKIFEKAQQSYDSAVSRYASQAKTKEPSAIREDAFALYEARKLYLKASFDHIEKLAHLRASFDSILITVFANDWLNQVDQQKHFHRNYEPYNKEMLRIRGWSNRLVNSIKSYQDELQAARKELEEEIVTTTVPQRDLHDYVASTVTYEGPDAPHTKSVAVKQGWLFVRSLLSTGKPVRYVWQRKWCFIDDRGTFGWLISNRKDGGVEESDKIGVLLCNVRTAATEERRFCFTVQTKNQNLLLQAENADDLFSWLQTFDAAKKIAFDASDSRDAFAITMPVASEFSINTGGTMEEGPTDRPSSHGLDSPPAPATPESARKVNRKIVQAPSSGGVASLIQSSHQAVLPKDFIGSAKAPDSPARRSTLAPSTLIQPPMGTTLSRQAVIAASQCDSPDPAVTSNLWGSVHWAAKTLAADEALPISPTRNIGTDDTTEANSPISSSPDGDIRKVESAVDDSEIKLTDVANNEPERSSVVLRRKAMSRDEGTAKFSTSEYPPGYPPELKVQDNQFHALFPTAPKNEKVLMILRASWNLSSRQAVSGRMYVTLSSIYFYSHFYGFVMVKKVKLARLKGVRWSSSAECEYLTLDSHEEVSVITIQLYLDSGYLCQQRLQMLIENQAAAEPLGIEEMLGNLIMLENDFVPPAESDAVPMSLDVDEGHFPRALVIDGSTSLRPGDDDAHANRFRLPARPVEFDASDTMGPKVVERQLDVSAKALFHIICGDKSAIFQKIYHAKGADRMEMCPWMPGLKRPTLQRDVKYVLKTRSLLHRPMEVAVSDTQIIQKQEEHVRYVIDIRKAPWNLPSEKEYALVMRLAVTHFAKSKCKLAVWTKVEWTGQQPPLSRRLIELAAKEEMAKFAYELEDTILDQAKKLGSNSRTHRAVQIYGPVGQRTTSRIFTADDLGSTLAADVNWKRVAARRKTLLELWLETLLLTATNVVSNALITTGRVLGFCWALASTHGLLMLVLVISGLANFLLVSRSSLGYWNERHAASLIRYAGVGPAPTMSRAVYVRDIEEMLHNSTFKPAAGTDADLCYAKFTELVTNDDVDEERSLHVPQSAPLLIRQRRRRLGVYRHDLMVAMRTVNKFEQVLMEASFSQFRQREAARCRQVMDMDMMTNGNSSSRLAAQKQAQFHDYCSSCEKHV